MQIQRGQESGYLLHRKAGTGSLPDGVFYRQLNITAQFNASSQCLGEARGTYEWVQSFNKFVDEVIKSQPAERHDELVEAFSGVLHEISGNLQPTDRERFTRNLTLFKQKTKNLLVL